MNQTGIILACLHLPFGKW